MKMSPPCQNRIPDYDPLQVQQIWEDCIELDIDLSGRDPFHAQSNKEYKSAIAEAKKMISAARRKQKASLKANDEAYHINREAFRAEPHSEQKVLESIMRFESRMMQLHHKECLSCNECSLNMKLNQRGICSRCADKKTNDKYTRENAMIPSWFDDDLTEHLEIPPELECLTICVLPPPSAPRKHRELSTT